MAKLLPHLSSSFSASAASLYSVLALKTFSSTPSVSAMFSVCKCKVNSCYGSRCLGIQLARTTATTTSGVRGGDRRPQRLCRSFRFQQTSFMSNLGSDDPDSSSHNVLLSSSPLLLPDYVQKLGVLQNEEEDREIQEEAREIRPRGSTVALGLGLVAGSVLVMIPGFASATTEAAAAAYSVEDAWRALVATEPKNALSIPTWIIHVASVVEWLTAMALVWRYGDIPGKEAWKGLSWGMVPLLGGAMCACTWHFFYNAPSLELLVVMQAALTAIGNCTMWIAAFRIYQASQQQSQIGSSGEGKD